MEPEPELGQRDSKTNTKCGMGTPQGRSPGQVIDYTGTGLLAEVWQEMPWQRKRWTQKG